jgi:hypothetical protein
MNGARRLARGLMVTAIVASVIAPASATTLRRSSLDKLVAENGAIVVGEVVDTRAHWNADHTFILTDVQVAVHDVLKGDVTDREISFTIMGGTVGDLTTLILGEAQLAPGNSYVLFLNREDLPGAQRVMTLRDHSQGAFDLKIDKGGLRAISQAANQPLVPDTAGIADAAGGAEGYPLNAMIQNVRQLVERPEHSGPEVQ